HGDVLLGGGIADLEPLQHLPRHARARVDLGNVEPFEKFLSPKRIASSAPAQSASNRRRHWPSGALSGRGEGRISLSRFPLQLRAVALHCAPVLPLLSAVDFGPRNFSPRRQNGACRFK